MQGTAVLGQLCYSGTYALFRQGGVQAFKSLPQPHFQYNVTTGLSAQGRVLSDFLVETVYDLIAELAEQFHGRLFSTSLFSLYLFIVGHTSKFTEPLRPRFRWTTANTVRPYKGAYAFE